MSRLVDLKLMGPNLPKKEGHEYRSDMFEQIPDIYVDSCEHEPVPSLDVSNINATIMKKDNNERKLSLSTKELIYKQNNDTFCSTVLRLINVKKCLWINIL